MKEGESMNVSRSLTILLLALSPCLAWSQTSQKPATVASTINKASDHYGQIVEYLRMNGLIPPASR
jgi:hypothetical protein